MKFAVNAITAAALFTALASQAGVLEIDQPLYSHTVQIQYYAPFGQSFNIAATQLESIAVLAVNMNAYGDYLLDRNITLNLHAGTGVAGPLLASRTLDAAALIGSATQAWLTFDFSALPLQPQAAYTFALQVATPRFGASAQQESSYTGGRALFIDAASGTEFGAEYDLTFRVTTVPEPAAAWLLVMGLGLGGLALLARQRAAGAADVQRA